MLLWTSMRRRRAIVATPGEWQCKTGGVRRLAVANGPNIFQMLLVSSNDRQFKTRRPGLSGRQRQLGSPTHATNKRFAIQNGRLIGPILWGHSGPLRHALSLSLLLSSTSLLSWTSMRRRRATVATPGEWQWKTASSGEWAQHFSNAYCSFCNKTQEKRQR